MSEINLNPEESDIDLGIDLSKNTESKSQPKKSADLQRTEEWREERRGNWTGSQIKALMSCSSRGSRKSWMDETKFLDFGDGSLKYIYSNAKERETGRYLETDSTKEMKYGTAVEDFVLWRANKMIESQGLYLEKVGFKMFEDIATAGVSSDAVVRKMSDNSIVASAEIKACSSWGTLFDRTFDLVDEKGKDFWQIQAQMEAWKVNETFYFVASPPKDINKYLGLLNAQSDVKDDLYVDWCNETEIEYQVIEKSPIHIINLRKRIEIAEEIITKYLETKENIRNIMYQTIDNHKGVEKIVIPERAVELISEEEVVETTEEIKMIETSFEEIKVVKINDEDFHDDLPF